MSVIAMQGCDLQFAANGTLPDTAKTIYVQHFSNITRVPGVNDQFTIYVKQEISTRGRLVVVSDPAEADLVLSGEVVYYGTYATTSNSISEPLDYADTLSISAKLVDRQSHKTIWSTPAISSRLTVPVVSQAIIATTPQFLRQNMRGPDLANLPDLQVAATQQATYKQQLMTQAAAELYTDFAWGI
ncbi:MAG: LPS assembly lipoprotein LptE [Candidatus Binataceae bacterium]